MRAAPWLAVAFAVAGCTANDDASSPPADTPASLAPGAAANQTIAHLADLTSDTFHLATPPRLNLTAPLGNTTILAAKSPYFPGETFVWNTTLRDAANLTGARTVLWLRVTQSVLQQGAFGDPGCTVRLTITLRHNATDTVYDGGCGSAGVGLVPPGDHRVDFSAPPGTLPGVLLDRGDNVTLQLEVDVTSTSGAPSLYIIGGSREFDSLVKLEGMKEKLPQPVNATNATSSK